MRVLILQAGFNEIGVINALHKMGHYVIAIGNQKGLVGQKLADEYYCIDYSKQDLVLEFAIAHKIDRVCACCNDTAVLTACYVAEKLRLKNYESYACAELISHKDLFKDYAVKKKMLVLPSYSFVDILAAKKYIQKAEYPLIVKPVDMSGGKGVKRCDNIQEAVSAIEDAFKISRTKKIVIERFVEGSQHGFCTFVKNRKVIACCSNDEISLVNPYRVEIDLFPSSNENEVKSILIRQVENIAEDLQLSDGIFHMQYIQNGKDIYILEVMRRIIGNMYSIPAQRACGFDWDYWEARASIGEDICINKMFCDNQGYYAYRAIVPPRNGCVKDVNIDERLMPYIFRYMRLWEKNQRVENYLSETLGIVFMQFRTNEEMQDIMLNHSDWIKVQMV